MKVQWNSFRNKNKPLLYRIFALMEMLIKPFSIITFSGILFCFIYFLYCRVTGNSYNLFSDARTLFFVTVSCSAAVGYVTNWIAIKMLFEPYEAKDIHILKFITLGIWKQGLIPKNKRDIAVKMADQIERELLDPEKIADELTLMISETVKDPATIFLIRSEVKEFIRSNQKTIQDFLIPRVESSLVDAVGKLLTPESIAALWNDTAVRWLEQKNNRQMIASEIIDLIRSKSPEIISIARHIVHEKIINGPSWMPVKERIASWTDSMIDWNEAENMISEKLRSGDITEMIEGEVVKIGERIRGILNENESEGKVNNFIGSVKNSVEKYLSEYIQKGLPDLVDRFLNSDDLWNWVEKKAIPALHNRFENWLKVEGQRKIIQKIDINNRVVKAVEGKDVREFQKMINAVAAEHLSAIQVMGFFLGGIAGIFLASII